jgi:hypothetical protein
VASIITVTALLAAGLVLVAGVAKLARPIATRDALALTRVRSSLLLVRLLGTAEITLAVAVLLIGGRLPFAALALAYAGFLVVSDRQRRAGRGCGCFGAPSTTVGPLHLGVDAVGMLAAASAAWIGAPGVPGLLPSGLLPAVATLGLLCLAVVLGQLTLTALPELLSVRSRAAGGATS